MTKDVFRQKQPFAPDAEMEALLRAWKTLDLSAEADLPPGKTNALNLRRPEPQVAMPEQDDQPAYKPLTAEDMEQIRQAAYEEGLAQGKEEGFSQGYAEGREQGQQDGMQQGLAEGRKQGLAEIQPELDEQKNQLAALLSQLQQPLAAVEQQVQQALTELALAMAQAVVGVEVTTNPTIILRAVQEATAALPLQTQDMRIMLHPDDLAIIRQHFTEEELQQRHWQLRADATLERGGCQVISEKSSVDRSLTQRMKTSLEHFLHQSDSSE